MSEASDTARQVLTPEGVDPAQVVTIALVLYNSEQVLPALIAALPAALDGVPARVVFVDNDSSDRSVAVVRTAAPWATVVETGCNGGYAAGVNEAIRASDAAGPVFVLNPDTVPQPGCVARLLDGLSRPGVGIAVPRILDGSGALKFSLRRDPSLGRALGEALLGGHRSARYSLLGEEIRDPAHYRDERPADWATGAAMVISRECLDRVGAWDESFFLYSEETDFALRARRAGFTMLYCPDAEVAHEGGQMEELPWLWSLVAVNRVRLYGRYHGRLATAAFWTVAVLNEAARALLGRRTNRAALKALLMLPVGGSPPRPPSATA